jgi:hypothetical protein
MIRTRIKRRSQKFHNAEMLYSIQFSEDGNLEAGIGSYFRFGFGISFLREGNKAGLIELNIFGHNWNGTKYEGELAEKVRDFVEELKTLNQRYQIVRPNRFDRVSD